MEASEGVKPFWSNCVIQAVKAHWRDPANVDYIVIRRPVGVHVMWYNKQTKRVYHFTDKKVMGYRRLSNLWFKGTIEEETVDGLRKWCEGNGIKFKW